jgi:hypothetical protein
MCTMTAGIIERALQLAAESASVSEVKRKLKAEGYTQIEEHLGGRLSGRRSSSGCRPPTRSVACDSAKGRVSSKVTNVTESRVFTVTFRRVGRLLRRGLQARMFRMFTVTTGEEAGAKVTKLMVRRAFPGGEARPDV